jgi:hypothetical protein
VGSLLAGRHYALSCSGRQETYDRQLAVKQRDAASQQRRVERQTQLYQSGLDSYQNVLTAQTALYNSQTSLVTARGNQLIRQVDLYWALGEGVKRLGRGCGAAMLRGRRRVQCTLRLWRAAGQAMK